MKNDKREIKKVEVTYFDKTGWWIFKKNYVKTFSPENWEIFGERVIKVAKTVKIIYKK